MNGLVWGWMDLLIVIVGSGEWFYALKKGIVDAINDSYNLWRVLYEPRIKAMGREEMRCAEQDFSETSKLDFLEKHPDLHIKCFGKA